MKVTEAQAANMLCPAARTFGDAQQAKPFCRGSLCMCWRWVPVTTADPRWREAMQEAIARNGDKPPHVKSAREVADAMKDTPSTHGYCGMGGPA